MSSTENNTQGARRDEQRTRFLSRENIVKMIKTTVVLSALFLSIWAVVLNQAIEPLDIDTDEEASILVKTCLLYTSPSPRDLSTSRMPSSA